MSGSGGGNNRGLLAHRAGGCRKLVSVQFLPTCCQHSLDRPAGIVRFQPGIVPVVRSLCGVFPRCFLQLTKICSQRVYSQVLKTSDEESRKLVSVVR